MTKITDEHDVVVIGAGAAGIAATRRLVEAGVDVLLLEACNRVGDRALSVRQGDGDAIDLGCGWLHSADVNPWTDIAAALGFEIDRTLPPWQDEKHDLGMSLAQRRAFRTASTRFWQNFDTATAPILDQPAAVYLEPSNPWNSLINATSTYINGAELDRVSALSRITIGTWAIGGWMWGGTDEAESSSTIRTQLRSMASGAPKRSSARYSRKVACARGS